MRHENGKTHKTQVRKKGTQKKKKKKRVMCKMAADVFSDLMEQKTYRIIFDASSASGSAQYLLARIKHASADSIYSFK